ncbi:MAG: amidohydrolase family protein [Steroidobacteraceae bacterium]
MALSLMSQDTMADVLSFKLFDGHMHPISDDTSKYPQSPQTMPMPGDNGMAANQGMTPGGAPAAGAPGGMASGPQGERIVPDFDKRGLKWLDEEGVAAIAAVQKRGTYGTDNSYTLDISNEHPDRLRAIVILDAEKPESVTQLRDMIDKRKAAGIRLTGSFATDGSLPWLNSPQARKVWEVANNAGAVVDLMVTSQDSTAAVPILIDLAKTYPKVRVVVDHVLSPKAESSDFGINATYAQLAKQRNIYLKYTIINLDSFDAAKVPTSGFVRKLVDVYGADHVLWGSDAGNSPGTYHELVGRIVASTEKLTDKEKHQVLHDTGDAVFLRGGKSDTK